MMISTPFLLCRVHVVVAAFIVLSYHHVVVAVKVVSSESFSLSSGGYHNDDDDYDYGGSEIKTSPPPPPPPIDIDLGMFQIDDTTSAINLTKTANLLLQRLDPTKGILATNCTLGVIPGVTSFHMFATIRTESCHYHPGLTISTVLYGEGRFFTTTSTTSSSPIVQPKGSVFVIPKGTPHAFGNIGGYKNPTIVTVSWSPPFTTNNPNNYTIPTTGCTGLPPTISRSRN